MVDKDSIIRILIDKFPGKVSPVETNPPQTAISAESSAIVELISFLTEHPDLKMNYLSAITGIDRTDSIEIVYFISSLEYRQMLVIKTKVDRIGGKIESIQHIIPAANWFEREIWELYGVDFVNHPDLRRFLLPDDWDQGNPMLRDWDGRDFIRMPEVQ